MASRRIVRAHRQGAPIAEPLIVSETASVTTPLQTDAIQIRLFKDIVNTNGQLFSHYSIDNMINNAIIIFNLESEYNYQMIDNIFRNIQSNIKEKFIYYLKKHIKCPLEHLFINENIMNIILFNAEQLSKVLIIGASSIKELNNAITISNINRLVKSYIIFPI